MNNFMSTVGIELVVDEQSKLEAVVQHRVVSQVTRSLTLAILAVAIFAGVIGITLLTSNASGSAYAGSEGIDPLWTIGGVLGFYSLAALIFIIVVKSKKHVGKLVETKIVYEEGGLRQEPTFMIGERTVAPGSIQTVIMVQENHPNGDTTTDLSLMSVDDEIFVVKDMQGWNETYELGKAVARALGKELQQTSVANSIVDGSV